MQILKRDLDKPISFKGKMSNFVWNLNYRSITVSMSG
jgi:hypothetical protein